MSSWTTEQRSKAAARAARYWAQRVNADRHATPLARARVGRDLTQRELGRLSGVSTATIAALEGGSGKTSPRVHERLARALALPESELFS
jgi:DNA-binding XRE family transcriptional regulator